MDAHTAWLNMMTYNALDDERVTKNEAKGLASGMLEMIARATHLQAMLQAMADK